jgi:transposase-like protein
VLVSLFPSCYLMTRSKGRPKVKAGDRGESMVQIDTPVGWKELVTALLLEEQPPVEVSRVARYSWQVEFATVEQAQRVGGSKWHVGEYVLLPRYLGRERKEVPQSQDKIQGLEARIEELSGLVASLIQKVSHEHISSSGAQPLMQTDTPVVQTTQSTVQAPSQFPGPEGGGLSTGWLHTPANARPPAAQLNTSIVSMPGRQVVITSPMVLVTRPKEVKSSGKYPTDTFSLQGQKPLMQSDTQDQEIEKIAEGAEVEWKEAEERIAAIKRAPSITPIREEVAKKERLEREKYDLMVEGKDRYCGRCASPVAGSKVNRKGEFVCRKCKTVFLFTREYFFKYTNKEQKVDSSGYPMASDLRSLRDW